MDFWELFRSVEIVWALWFSSLTLLVLLSRCLLRRMDRVNYRTVLARFHPLRFHRDTRGAAYSLSFIMVLPFLIFLIALIIETTFMLVAKIGTMQAAFAAARTASVWTTQDTHSPGEFSSKTHAKAKQAAIVAMVPYASGYTNSSTHQKDAEKYLKIYEAFNNMSSTANKSSRSLFWEHFISLNREYIIKRYNYAAQNVEVDPDYDPRSRVNDEKWKKHIQAKVSYRYPFKIMPLGPRLGGIKKPDGTYVYEISSIAKINNECPRNEYGKISIQLYD